MQVQLLGQSISVGRPSGYVDPSRAQEAAAAAAAALQAFQVCSILPSGVVRAHPVQLCCMLQEVLALSEHSPIQCAECHSLVK